MKSCNFIFVPHYTVTTYFVPFLGLCPLSAPLWFRGATAIARTRAPSGRGTASRLRPPNPEAVPQRGYVGRGSTTRELKINRPMANTTHIIQWNCRSLRSNYPDLEILSQTLSPAAICLQETLQNDTTPITFRNYSQYFKNALKADGSPCGGVAVFVKNSIPHSHIPLTTPLQATAVRNFGMRFQSCLHT